MGDRSEETDEGPDGRYVAPVGRVGRRTSIVPWVLVAGLALGVAILKPWGQSAGPSPATHVPPASHPAAATDEVLGDVDLTSTCHNTDAWLLATVETSRGQTVRVLRVLSPTGSVGPGDSRIARVAFGSERVMDLGWCAPVVGDGRSRGITRVEAWVVVDGRAHPVPLVDDMPAGGPRFGALYLAPQDASMAVPRGRPGRLVEPAGATWATGVYVFTLHDSDGGIHSFAVDLEILPPRVTPSPAPATPAGGPPATVPVPSNDDTADVCIGSDSWLVASEEQIAGRAIRTWSAVAPVDKVVGPDDPAIPWVPVTSDSLAGLGWCGPAVGTGALVDPTVVEAWAVSADGLRTLVLLRLGPTGPPSVLGGLYRPAFAPTAPGATVAWPVGRYLFRVRSGDGRVFTFGVEVAALPGR